MAKLASLVISHWSHLIENFQTSPVEFYASVERAVAARAVPEMNPSRVEHKEAGLASAHRQYLRLHRGKNAFDICCAPFGTGCFVSWWLTEPPLRFAFLYTLGFFVAVAITFNIAAGIGFAIGAATGGFGSGTFLSGLFMLAVPVLLWFLGNAVREGVIQGESTVLAMPIVGWLYERVFAPATFYAIDTSLMFQDAVHNAVMEVVDGLLTAKGLRSLTETERKPIMKGFFQ